MWTLITRTRQLRVVSLLLIVMVAAAAVVPGNVAQASASSCRSGGSGYFCFHVEGSGTYIRTVTFERAKSGMIRNPSVEIWIVAKDLQRYKAGGYSEARSWWGARAIKLWVGHDYAVWNAAQVCGQWREDGYSSEICHRLN